MGVLGLIDYLRKRGGAAQWKRKALQQPDIKLLLLKRREAAIEEWVLNNRDETEEWIVELEDEPKVAQWINKRRDLHSLGPVGKIAIDSGQWYSALEHLRKQLEHRLHTDTPKEVRQRFEYARLRMINTSLKLKARSFGPDVHFIVTFDHPHARPEAKKETLERRLRSQVVTSLDLETKSEARLSAAKNKKLRRSRRVARKSKSEGEGEVADKGKGKSTSEGEGKGEGEEQMEEAPVQISISDADRETAFPPFDPFDSEAIRKLRESGDEWDCRIADEAEQLLLLADQVVAKTEADYIIPVLVDSTTTRQQHEAVVDKIVRRSVPSSGEVHDDASKVIVSMDSDSIVSTDRTVADFIVLPLRSKQIRVVDVKSLYSAMGWTDRWHAAGLAAFVGNDFTGGGITGVGYKSLAEKGELDRIAKSSKTWCQARRDLQTSGTTQELIDGQKFTSIDALSRHFDSIVSRHSQNSSNTRPRLTFNAWSSSVTIQAGWRPSGAIVDKRVVLSNLKRGLHDQVAEAKIALASRQSDAMQIDDSTSPPSRRPRDRGHRVLFRRRQQALTFDARITNVVDCPRPIKGQLGFRVKAQANGPEYFRLLRDEADRLKVSAAARDDDEGPPRKRRKTGNRSKAASSVEEAPLEVPEGEGVPDVGEGGEGGEEGDGGEGGEEGGGGEEGEEDEGSEAGEAADSDGDGKPKRNWKKRFPNILSAKQAVIRKPACSRVLRNLVIGGDTRFRSSFTNLLHWIRQIEIVEMPLKVDLVNAVLGLYARFAPAKLLTLVRGGNKFTVWAHALLLRRQFYDFFARTQQQVAAPDADAQATLADAVKAETSGSLADDLGEFVRAHDLTSVEAEFVGDRGTAGTLDMCCNLAIVLDRRHGNGIPTLCVSEFNQRNLMPFGTSVAVSTERDAKKFDSILAKLIVEFPEHFRVDAHSLPFGVDNADILAALKALTPDEATVLASLSSCAPARSLVCEAIATMPIAGDATPAADNTRIAELAADFQRMLLEWQLPPTLVIGSSAMVIAASKISDYIGKAVLWAVTELRRWVQELKCEEFAKTLRDWIAAVVPEDADVKGWKGKGRRFEKKDANAKDPLKALMVVVAGHSRLRHRTYRFSPSTIWVSPGMVRSMFANNFDLCDKIMVHMQRNAREIIELNSQLGASRFEVKEFPVPEKPTPIASKVFNPDRIAGETIARFRKRDTTTRRQLANPKKLVTPELHEWEGIKFEPDSSNGPFLVLTPTQTVRDQIKAVIDKVKAFFDQLALKKGDVEAGCVFVMDILFKANSGQLLLNGDIGLDATEWFLGVIDPRKRTRKVVESLTDDNRDQLGRERLLADMSSNDKLVKILKDLDQVELEEHVVSKRALTEEEKEAYCPKQEQRQRFGPNAKARRLPSLLELPTVRRVTLHFGLAGDKIEFRSPLRRRSDHTLPPRRAPEDRPIRIYDEKPPALWVLGVPETARDLDRPKRALDLASTFFSGAQAAEARLSGAGSSNARTEDHVLVAHDAGQIEAVVTSFLKLTGSGSSRVMIRQRQFKAAEAEESKISRVLQGLSLGSRLGQAPQGALFHNRDSIHPSQLMRLALLTESRRLVASSNDSSVASTFAYTAAPSSPVSLLPPLPPLPAALSIPASLLPPLPPLPAAPSIPASLLPPLPPLPAAPSIPAWLLPPLPSLPAPSSTFVLPHPVPPVPSLALPPPLAAPPVPSLALPPPLAAPPVPTLSLLPPLAAPPVPSTSTAPDDAALAPERTVRLGTSVLSVKSPILRHVLQSKGSHLSTLRSKETAGLLKKRVSSRTSAVVRTVLAKPAGWSSGAKTTKVLHIAPSGRFTVNQGFGKDQSPLLIASLEEALRTTPWLDVTTVACSEGWTSSVCHDPRCRATIYQPCRHSSLANSPIRRLKYCMFCLTMDHRDGLASLNVSSLAYLVTQELGENPFSLKSARGRKESKRVSASYASRVEKMVANAVRGKTDSEVRDLLDELSRETSVGNAVELLKNKLAGFDPDFEEEADWESDDEGGRNTEDEEEEKREAAKDAVV
ncbi:uncharacterized protein JCM15063_003481 [Sporobolomyces koalae]|uniref:uncharacterized protein n=1 Tax=Sporobolomyces koalae TaxID=500713 RepID=UPI00317A8AEA